MNFLISGGTGLIGSALCCRLLADQHHIVILSRRPERVIAPMLGVKALNDIPADMSFDAVINLAGEAIADKRWSEAQKKELLNSRLQVTHEIVNYLQGLTQKPRLLISGSAVGYYGTGIDGHEVDESARGDASFSSQLCQQWEAEALKAHGLGIRCCLLRTGIVLAKNGGALSKMLPAFKVGLGGRLGGGQQWMPWIHLDDLLGIILHCIADDQLSGAINGVSPQPVTNEVFTKALAKTLHRPRLLPLPACLLTLLMGQMAEELLLSGKKVMPVKALTSGYAFQYKCLDDALVSIL